MKTEIRTYFFYLGLIVLLTNCASPRVSTIVGGDYNETKDETDYFVMPYGSVFILGKWIKTNYNSVSTQQFFKNSDSITIAIAFGRFTNTSLTGTDNIKGSISSKLTMNGIPNTLLTHTDYKDKKWKLIVLTAS